MNDKAKRFDMLACVNAQFQARGLTHYDAGETAVFARELEYLQAEAIEALYPEYTGANLVPIVGGGIAPGMRTHTYREISGFGEAELLENMTIEDFPTAEVRGAETTGKFRSFGAKYIVTVEELRARAAGMAIDVEAQKGAIARQVMESKLDKLIWESASGPFTGLLNDSNSQDDTSADDWETGTEAGDVAAALATFRRIVNAGFEATKGLFREYDFVLSTKQWLKMNLFVPSTTVGGGTTLGSFLLNHVAGVRSISHSARLDGAGTGGKDRMMAFPRDPKVLDALIPIRFEQFAPQLNGMAFVTVCHGKYGGLRIKHPKAVRRADVTMT